MPMYDVEIVETLSRTIRVDTDTPEDAEMMVRDAYRRGDYVLTSDDFTGEVEFTTREQEPEQPQPIRRRYEPER